MNVYLILAHVGCSTQKPLNELLFINLQTVANLLHMILDCNQLFVIGD